MNRVDYYLKCKRIGYKSHYLTIEQRDRVVYEKFFTHGQELELYLKMFEEIRSENKLCNQIAFLHIPDYWYDNEYKNLLEAFNYGQYSIKTSRDGITLLN